MILPWSREDREEENEFGFDNSLAVPKQALAVNVGSDVSSDEDDVEGECM
jgi:hypothetical protein